MLLWIIAVTLAYFIKGVTGFANTLVISSIMSFGANTVSITPVETLLSIPSSAAIAFRERKSVSAKKTLPLIALVLLGSLPGVFLLRNADAGALKIVCGLLIAGIGVEMLLREHINQKTKPSKALLVGIGVLAGLCCGLYGIGALLAAYFGRTESDSASFKGNLCTVFVADSLFRVIVYAIGGLYTWEILRQILLLAPFMAIGLGAGMFCAGRLNEKRVKQCVVVMLILSGLMLVVRNL